MPASSSNVLLDKQYGRRPLFKRLLHWLPSRVLHASASRHIAENKRQLVVFSFDHVGHSINLNGIYESKELETFFSWMNSCGNEVFDGAAVDIGANIGNHSLYFSDYYRKVYSFEPHSRIFKVLSINADLASNVQCFNFGISNQNRQVTMNIDPVNMGGSSISDSPSGNTQRIEVRTLDSVLDASEPIRLIKIDVEGHEYQALRGSEQTIRRHKPVILFEQHAKDFTQGESPVINLLKEFGYRRFAIVHPYPRCFPGRHIVVRQAYNAVSRLLSGESMRIAVSEHIVPDFYSFIVAIPDWLEPRGLAH